MKQIDDIKSENYDQGLSRIRASIKLTLTEAGAKMETGCVFSPDLRKPKLRRVATPITAVPWNGPKMTVEFTTGEIVDSWHEVHAGVQSKIARYVATFLKFHERTDRSALHYRAESRALADKPKAA